MKARWFWAAVLVASPVVFALVQSTSSAREGDEVTTWRRATPRVADRGRPANRPVAVAPAAFPTPVASAVPVAAPAAAPAVAPASAPFPVIRASNDEPAAEAAPARARVVTGDGRLPASHNQVYREYDISPFTSQVTTTRRPEQLVIDWILRETGYEAWHSDVPSILSADSSTLRVYHTNEMQRVVSDMVDRFVNQQQHTHAYGLRVVTIGSPNWRETALSVLKPIPVQAQGVQAWLLNKEDAALLFASLSKRSDFREYSSPQLMVYHGQSLVLGTTRPRQYARSILPRPGAFPPYELEIGRIDEGFSLELSPIASLDGSATDAVIKCSINQVERMVGLTMDIPVQGGTRREKIEVPQMTSCDLHERFRWPTDQVLLVSRGVVATPAPTAGALPFTLPGAPPANRADALVFVQSRGKVAPIAQPPAAAPAAAQPAPGAAAPITPLEASGGKTTDFRARR